MSSGTSTLQGPQSTGVPSLLTSVGHRDRWPSGLPSLRGFQLWVPGWHSLRQPQGQGQGWWLEPLGGVQPAQKGPCHC